MHILETHWSRPRWRKPFEGFSPGLVLPCGLIHLGRDIALPEAYWGPNFLIGDRDLQTRLGQFCLS